MSAWIPYLFVLIASASSAVIRESSSMQNLGGLGRFLNVHFSSAVFKGVGILPELPENWIRRVIHNHELVAISDWDEKGVLRRCDLIEVYKLTDKEEVLKNLTKFNQFSTSFENIKKLMLDCDQLDEDNLVASPEEPFDIRNLSLVIGILPGTNWCGPGDKASSYNDLGSNRKLDRCCRAHDLCPVKVSGLQTNYGLKNWAPYTKTHCDCDDVFYDCLKSLNQMLPKLMGTVYYNILRLQCVDGDPDLENVAMKFSPQRRSF